MVIKQEENLQNAEGASPLLQTKKARSSYAGHSNPSDFIYKPKPRVISFSD